MKQIYLPLTLAILSFNTFANASLPINSQSNSFFVSDSVLPHKIINQKPKEIGNLSSYYLDNGIKVILLPFPNTEKTGIYFTARVGSKHEGYGETGMAHLLEHMLFKGTPNFSDIKKEMNDLGSHWNGFTSADQTTYFEIFNNDPENKKLDKLIQMEGERFFEATFKKEDLDKEMTVVRNELERNASSSSNKLWEATLKNTFDWHGYKHPTIGEKSDIENAPFSKLREFYKKYYQPKNTFMIIYGDFDKEKIKPIIEKHLSKHKNIDNFPINDWTQEPFYPKQGHSTIYTEDDIISSNIVWKAPNFLYDKRQIAADVLFNSVTQAPYGKIYKKHVLEQANNKNNLVHDISTFLLPFNDYSPFVLGIEQKVENNKNPKQNLTPIISDLESKKFFNISDFEKTKQSMLNDVKKIENDPESLTNAILHSEAMGDWSIFFYQKELLEKASFQDGLSFIEDYINPYNRVIVTIKKDKSLKNNPYYLLSQKNNSVNYRNHNIDSINDIQNKDFKFSYNQPDKFLPTLQNLKEQTKEFNIEKNGIKITGKILPKNIAGDFVYFNLYNGYGNESLHTKYDKSCQLLEIAPGLGSKNYNKEKVEQIMREKEADFSLSFSSLMVKVPKKNFKETTKILFNVLMNPTYDTNEYEKNKKQILSNLESSKTDVNFINNQKVNKSLNPYPKGHPLYPDSLEDGIEIVKKSSIKDLKQCYEVFKGATNPKISVVGNIPISEIEDSLSDYLTWKSTHSYKRIKDDKIKPVEQVISEHGGTDTKVLTDIKKPNSFNHKKAFLPIRIDHPDYTKIRLALTIFGESSNSRLFQNLRENNGLSYTAQSSISASHFDEKTSIQIFVISSVENAEKSNEIINKTWLDFIQKGITSEELEFAKKTILDSRRLALSEDTGILGLLNFLKKNEKPIDWLIEYDKKIENHTLEEVNEAIKKHLSKIQFITVYNK